MKTYYLIRKKETINIVSKKPHYLRCKAIVYTIRTTSINQAWDIYRQDGFKGRVIPAFLSGYMPGGTNAN